MKVQKATLTQFFAISFGLGIGFLPFFSGAARDSGGGDPEAYIFVLRLREAADILERSSNKQEVEPRILRSASDEIFASLNDSDASNDLVEFVTEKISIGGVEKPAMFDGDIGRIRVSRSAWLN